MSELENLNKPNNHQIEKPVDSVVLVSSESETEEVKRLFSLIITDFDEIISYKQSLDDLGRQNDYKHELFNQAIILNEEVISLYTNILDDNSANTRNEQLARLKQILEEIKSLKKKVIDNVKELGFDIVEEEDSQAEIESSTDEVREVSRDDVDLEPVVTIQEEKVADDVIPTEPEVGFAVEKLVTEETDYSGKIEFDFDIYHRWQTGDTSILGNEWGKSRNKIKDDIRVTLEAAGYEVEEINNFFHEVVNPWSEDVKFYNKPKKGPGSWGELRRRILTAVQEKIQGREPNPEVFRQYYMAKEKEAQLVPEVEPSVANQTESTEPDTATPEVTTTGEEADTKNDTESSVDEALLNVPVVVEKHEALKEQLTKKGLDISQHYKLLEAEKHLNELTRLAAEAHSGHKPKPERVAQRVYALTVIDEELKQVLAEANSTETATTADLIEATLPDVIPLGYEKYTPDNVDTPLPEEPPLTHGREPVSETRVFDDESLIKYQEKRESWRKSNKDFKKIENELNQAKEEYYKDRSLYEKVKVGGRALFGLKPKFPPELEILQAKYQTARQFYTRDFADLLALRGAAHEGNIDRSLNRDEVKMAFGRKFILRPAEKQLKMQEKIALTEAQSSKMREIMILMSKHKWGIRLGTVVMAGTIGAFTGGASLAAMAAGSRVARIGAGMLGGAVAGTGVNRAMKGYVETASNRVFSAKESAGKNFSLESLNELESELLEANADEDTRKARRMAATIAAAGVGGFASGYEAGVLTTDAIPTTTVSPESIYRDDTMLSGSDPMNDNIMEAGTPFSIPNYISVLSENHGGGVVKTIVSGIELQGQQTGNLNIPADKLVAVQNLTWLTVNDTLSAHPHMPKVQIEEILSKKLGAKFGTEDWWKNAEIKHVRIGSIDVEREEVTHTIPELTPELTHELTHELIHEVESGDNLSTILDETFKTELDHSHIKLPAGVAREDLLKLIYQKFPEMADAKNSHWTLSPQEWKALGVESGNPQQIRVGEKIDVQKLIDKLSDQEIKINHSENYNITSQTSSSGLMSHSTDSPSPVETFVRPKTGPLPINQIDPFEKQIKISQEMPWKPLTPSELESARVQGILDGNIETKPVHDVYHIPDSPRLGNSVRNFFDSHEYQNYLKENGVNKNLLEKVIAKTVADFEGSTMTRSEEIWGKYDSPYEKLSRLTMGELAKIQERSGNIPLKIQIELQKFAGHSTHFKPQTLNAWANYLDQVKAKGNIPYTENTTLRDLFKRDAAARMIEATHKQILAKSH